MEPIYSFSFHLKKRISKVGPDYSSAVKQLASSYQAPGTRLHRKLRKRLHKLGALSLHSSSKQERSLASFTLQRMLSSDQVLFIAAYIYIYICCTQAVQQPGRTSKINGTEFAAKDPGV